MVALAVMLGGGCGDGGSDSQDAQLDFRSRYDTAPAPDIFIRYDSRRTDSAPDGNDGGDSDGDVGDGNVTDGDVTDGQATDGAVDAADDMGVSDAQPDAGPGPDVATISEPVEDDYVFGEITVAGTGEPDATLRVRVLKGESVLGNAAGNVDSSGDFSLLVGYTGAGEGDNLDVEVVLTNAEGSSLPAVVRVVHTDRRYLSGKVEQSGGSFDGDTVHVRLYTSNADADLTRHIQERNLATTHGQRLTNGFYRFLVAPGTYYVRAFRDSDGPQGTGPDQQPTLQIDAQAPALTVVLGDTHSDGNDLTLNARTDTDDQYGGLDARLVNQSAAEHPPERWIGEQGEIGRGLCGGFYMNLRAMRQGNAANLSLPYSRLPASYSTWESSRQRRWGPKRSDCCHRHGGGYTAWCSARFLAVRVPSSSCRRWRRRSSRPASDRS